MAQTIPMAPPQAPADVELQQAVLDELAWDGHVRPQRDRCRCTDPLIG